MHHYGSLTSACMLHISSITHSEKVHKEIATAPCLGTEHQRANTCIGVPQPCPLGGISAAAQEVESNIKEHALLSWPTRIVADAQPREQLFLSRR